MKRASKSLGIIYEDNTSRKMTKKDRLEQELNATILLSENRQTIKEVIESRMIKTFWVGRRCTGTKMIWVGEERCSIPVYKDSRWRIEFTDGLRINVDKAVFNYYRKNRQVQYFSWYD